MHALLRAWRSAAASEGQGSIAEGSSTSSGAWHAWRHRSMRSMAAEGKNRECTLTLRSAGCGMPRAHWRRARARRGGLAGACARAAPPAGARSAHRGMRASAWRRSQQQQQQQQHTTARVRRGAAMLGLAHSDSRSDCCACHPCRPHHGKQTRSGGAAPRALLWAPLTQAVASVVLGRLPQRHGAFADVQPVRTRRSKSAAAPAAAADAAADAAAKEVMCMLRTGEWLRAGKDTARQAQVAALRPGACTAIGRSHQSPRVTAGEKKRGHGCFIGLQARLERAVADREECMGGNKRGGTAHAGPEPVGRGAARELGQGYKVKPGA
jgi:hypothetical protein